MSKKKLLSVALAGGLVATSADAVETKPAMSDSETDIITGVADDLLLFGGEFDDVSEVGNLILGPIIEVEDATTEDSDFDFEMAQTIYSGCCVGDDLRSAPRTGNITLDNGIKKPKGITLDNGIKRGNRLKPKGNSRKLRGGKRKRRN